MANSLPVHQAPSCWCHSDSDTTFVWIALRPCVAFCVFVFRRTKFRNSLNDQMNEAPPGPTLRKQYCSERREANRAAAAAVDVGVKSPRCWTLWPLTPSFCPLCPSIGASCWALWVKTKQNRTFHSPLGLTLHVPKITREEKRKKKVSVDRWVLCLSQWGKKTPHVSMFTVVASFLENGGE